MFPILFVFLLVVVRSQQVCREEIVRYVITIDAGSTGSRVHIHNYFLEPGASIPKFSPISQTIKQKPGLSSFEDRAFDDVAGKSLNGLIQYAMDTIPEIKWQTTPIYLKATAGLRSIPEDKAEGILKSCQKILASSPFVFIPDHAKVISGTDEGKFGWIAANYLVGRFSQKKDQAKIGVIEMGGASVQISFLPQKSADTSKLTPVQVGDQKFDLYTHSFLNYGLQAAQKLILEKTDVTNPCYPPGLSFDGIQGQGDYDMCYALLDTIIDKKATCESTCSFNGVFQPLLDKDKFFAIENFYYTSQFFGVHDSPNVLRDLQEKGREFCSTSWNQIIQNYAEESVENLQKYCFSAVYIPKLMFDGLGINPEDPGISVIHSVNRADIEWPLGSAIYEVSSNVDLLPPALCSTEQTTFDSEHSGPSFVFLFFLATVTVGMVVLVFRAYQQRSRSIPFTQLRKV